MPWARGEARRRRTGWDRLVLAVAALPPILLLVAAAPDAAWDDAKVIHAGGGTFLLDSAVETVIAGSAAMHASMRRIGLKRACAIASAARRQAVAAEAEAFLPALVAAMRAQIPPERLTGPAFPAFNGTAQLPFKARVSAALERGAAPIYTRARTHALARFEREAPTAPAISGDWSDIFADWDLSTANAVSTACLMYRLPDPAGGKQAFDTFYQRKETR